MKTTEIKRVEFQAFDNSIHKERADLARNASSRLGYKKLAMALTVPGALMKTLRELGIEPMVSSQVEEYKRKKAKPGMWSGHKAGIAWWMAIVTLLPIVGTILFRYTAFDKSPYTSSPLEVAATLSFVTVCILSLLGICRGVFLLFYDDARGSRTVRVWSKVKLKDYDGNVPEGELSKALEINKVLPDATFSVERLYESTETVPSRPTPDPFLLVYLGDEGYYIGVWDEKEYEARM